MQDVPVKFWSINKIMRAVNLWRDGLTPDEIACQLAVSEHDVRDHLPEMQKFGLSPVDRL